MKKAFNKFLSTGSVVFVCVLIISAVIVRYVLITQPSNDHLEEAVASLTVSAGNHMDNTLKPSGKIPSEINENLSGEDRLVQEFKLFGDDAEDIWSEEVARYEQRKMDVRDTIARLDDSNDTTIYEKLDEYQNSLNRAYEDSPEAYVLQNKDLLAKVFFGLNSVQNELKEMDPDQRKLEINSIRNEMGYTQAQIEKLEDFDDYRNRRWDNGLAYMEERDRIVRELEGPELETAINELRETYFKHEAKTIRIEEEDGFFRYTRKRVYGRN